MLSQWRNAFQSFVEGTMLTPLQQHKMELKIFISLQKSEKCNSHRNKAFVSSLEDTHLGPMQKLKMEVKFFTSL